MITFLPTEIAMLRNVPEDDLVALAAELDIAVPAAVQREQLVAAAVVALAQLARREGLPLSDYDRDDLEALPASQLRALASLCGVDPSVDALLKSGARVYKVYRRRKPGSQVALLLPMLLPALARHAEVEEGPASRRS